MQLYHYYYPVDRKQEENWCDGLLNCIIGLPPLPCAWLGCIDWFSDGVGETVTTVDDSIEELNEAIAGIIPLGKGNSIGGVASGTGAGVSGLVSGIGAAIGGTTAGGGQSGGVKQAQPRLCYSGLYYYYC